jgi:hypothetical protein
MLSITPQVDFQAAQNFLCNSGGSPRTKKEGFPGLCLDSTDSPILITVEETILQRATNYLLE